MEENEKMFFFGKCNLPWLLSCDEELCYLHLYFLRLHPTDWTPNLHLRVCLFLGALRKACTIYPRLVYSEKYFHCSMLKCQWKFPFFPVEKLPHGSNLSTTPPDAPPTSSGLHHRHGGFGCLLSGAFMFDYRLRSTATKCARRHRWLENCLCTVAYGFCGPTGYSRGNGANASVAWAWKVRGYETYTRTHCHIIHMKT